MAKKCLFRPIVVKMASEGGCRFFFITDPLNEVINSLMTPSVFDGCLFCVYLLGSDMIRGPASGKLVYFGRFYRLLRHLVWCGYA